MTGKSGLSEDEGRSHLDRGEGVQVPDSLAGAPAHPETPKRNLGRYLRKEWSESCCDRVNASCFPHSSFLSLIPLRGQWSIHTHMSRDVTSHGVKHELTQMYNYSIPKYLPKKKENITAALFGVTWH